jgi:hypothetical protein
VLNELLHGLEPSRRNSARNRNAMRVGFALSVLIHGALLFGWRSSDSDAPASSAAGPRAGDARAAAGGGEMLAIAIAAPRPIVIPAPPSTRPRFVEPDVAAEEPERLVLTADLSGPSGGAAALGDNAGPGLPGADGGGDGGNNPEGRDRRTDATPRSIIPIWDAPGDVKGMRVTVHVQVDARGEPTGEIRVEPRIPNSGFDRELRKDLLSMDYFPARRDGLAVADWAEMTFTF